MSYQLIIFDWQGTLTDVRGQYVAQFIEVAAQLGITGIDEAELRERVDMDICQLVTTLLPNIDKHQQFTLIENFKDYRMHHYYDVCLRPGVQPLLDGFKKAGYWLAIATSASLATIEKELSASGLSQLFDVIKTPDHTLNKPAPDMLNEIMVELNCDPKQTVMIGDSRCDFEAAQHAKVSFVGVHIRNQNLLNDIDQADFLSLDKIVDLPSLMDL